MTQFKATAQGQVPMTAQEEAEFEASRVPVVQVPQSVTRRQARQALAIAGKLALVQPAIDAIADPATRTMMQIEWEDSLSFERNRPSLIQMAAAIGLNSEQIDALFIEAAKL